MIQNKQLLQNVSRVTAADQPHEITLTEETSKLQTYLKAATAHNTRKAYQSDIQHFMTANGLLPANTETVLNYLQKFADKLNPRTLQRRLTSLKQWHVYQGFPDPTSHPLVRKTMTGIYHLHGQPTLKAPPLSMEQLTQLAHYLQSRGRLSDWRDNALLQIGFFGAFRRSELTMIRWEHIRFVAEGIEILIPRSKTDQAGEGQVCAIPYGQSALCPVLALEQWREKSGNVTGFVFSRINKSGLLHRGALVASSVNTILKKHAKACQFPQADTYSGHSLRRGFATSAAQSGATLSAIMRQGRWRHEGTVHGYVEDGQRFEENAAGLLLNIIRAP